MTPDAPFAILDLETTGITPATDHVIEVAVLRTRGLTVEESFTSLVRSPSPVGRSARVHGIEDAALEGAPRLAELDAKLIRLFEGATIVAHRGAFDRAFIDAAVQRGELSRTALDRPWIDTALLGERALGEGGLRAIATRTGGPLPIHRALPDTLAALGALGAVCEVLAPRNVEDLLALHESRATMRDDVAAMLEDARARGEPVGLVYRPPGKRAREDRLQVESVEPPYVRGLLENAQVRRILRGDRILRAWLGARPNIRFLDEASAPRASPDVGDSRS